MVQVQLGPPREAAPDRPDSAPFFVPVAGRQLLLPDRPKEIPALGDHLPSADVVKLWDRRPAGAECADDLGAPLMRALGCDPDLPALDPREDPDARRTRALAWVRDQRLDALLAIERPGRAADGGLAEAQVEYGVMLFKGHGVAVNEARAAKLFRLAAEQGNPVAQNRLARLYANGVVVKADPVQAAKWHLLARSAGVSDFSLDIVLSKLSKEERAEAEKEAEDWRNGKLGE